MINSKFKWIYLTFVSSSSNSLLQEEKLQSNLNVIELHCKNWILNEKKQSNVSPAEKYGQEQAWLQPYKAPCIVESGSYAITIVQSPNAFFNNFQEFRKKQSDGQTYNKEIRYRKF